MIIVETSTTFFSFQIFQIYLHGKSLESLHNHIPKEILPAEYGGTQSNFDNTIWRKSILNDAEYFHHLEWYKNCIWDDEEDEDQSIFDENLSDSGSLNVNAISIPFINVTKINNCL